MPVIGYRPNHASLPGIPEQDVKLVRLKSGSATGSQCCDELPSACFILSGSARKRACGSAILSPRARDRFAPAANIQVLRDQIEEAETISDVPQTVLSSKIRREVTCRFA